MAATKHHVVLLGLEHLGASEERRLATGAQVSNLPHKKFVAARELVLAHVGRGGGNHTEIRSGLLQKPSLSANWIWRIALEVEVM
jgi:hypothetical protein